MKITDPGPQYEYLIIETDHGKLQVLKQNRAIRFDAFWATEPVMDEGKPDLRMAYSEIPQELWEVLNEEERLTATLAGAERENRRLKKEVEKQKQSLFVAVVIILSFIAVKAQSYFG